MTKLSWLISFTGHTTNLDSLSVGGLLTLQVVYMTNSKNRPLENDFVALDYYESYANHIPVFIF